VPVDPAEFAAYAREQEAQLRRMTKSMANMAASRGAKVQEIVVDVPPASNELPAASVTGRRRMLRTAQEA